MPAIVMGQLSEKNVCPRNASPEFLTFFETFCEIDPNSNGTFFFLKSDFFQLQILSEL